MLYLYYLCRDDIVLYVGLTKNIKERKREHKRNKPPHTFKVVLEFDNLDKATLAESEHIFLHNTYKNGWNKTSGGEYKNNSGYERKGIGGVFKGNVPWNKGKFGYKLHNEETLKKLSSINCGEFNRNSKLCEDDVSFIISEYIRHPDINDVGKVMRNGRLMSYERAFSLKYAKEFNVTPENITRILKKKSWNNLWDKFIKNV